MSVRTPAQAFARMPHEAYYTPAHAVHSLLRFADEVGLFAGVNQLWEPAAGAGHIAKALFHEGKPILATDLHPAKKQLVPITKLDFLDSIGPSGGACAIITNPPYGVASKQALDFIKHGLFLMETRAVVTLALLLPFEIDASARRDYLLGGHPYFLRKVTCASRIRWVNLPQSMNSPMGHHAWFIWTRNMALHRAARGPGVVR